MKLKISKELLRWTQFIANISVIIGVVLIIISYLHDQISQNTLVQTTVNSCMSRFTELRPKLSQIKDFRTDTSTVINSYLDLCEEELFYIQHDIIPQEIAEDWVSGMQNFLKKYNYDPEMYKTYHRINAGFGYKNIYEVNIEKTKSFIKAVKEYKKE